MATRRLLCMFLSFAANEGFVYLNRATFALPILKLKSRALRASRRPLKHEPCSLLGDAQIARNLIDWRRHSCS